MLQTTKLTKSCGTVVQKAVYYERGVINLCLKGVAIRMAASKNSCPVGNNFQDTLNPLCTCGCDVENKCHFLLHCSNFLTERNTLLNKITHINSNILNQADATITKTLLFGNSKYSSKINLQTLNASIDFILTSKRFDEPLY